METSECGGVGQVERENRRKERSGRGDSMGKISEGREI